jgi:hypothetical protein
MAAVSGSSAVRTPGAHAPRRSFAVRAHSGDIAPIAQRKTVSVSAGVA